MTTIRLKTDELATVLAALKAAQSALNQIPRKSLSGEHKDSYAVASLVDAAVKAMEGGQ